MAASLPIRCNNRRMLKQRVLTALVLAPVVLAAIFYLPSTIVTLVVALVMLLSARELIALAGVESLPRQTGILFINASIIAALWYWPALQPPVLFAAAGLWLLSFTWLARSPLGSARHGGWRLLKLALAGLITVPAWIAISRLHAWHPGWLIALLFLVWGADVGAYVAGKTIGRHKLAPRISPGKTWEGLIGGIITATLLMALAAWFTATTPIPWPQLLIASALIALISVGGDLLVSLLKRHAGSKDTGHLLPGHGGLMDRIDSLCAAAPFFALAVECWRNSL